MARRLISPMNDYAFKWVLGDPNRVDIITDLLQAIVEDIPAWEYEKVQIVDTHTIGDLQDDKVGILDIKLETKAGTVVDIEVQVDSLPHIWERMVFYSAHLITDQISRGQDYLAIQRTITIVITGYTMFPNDSDYYHCFTLYDQKARLEYPKRLIEIHALETTKLPSEADRPHLWTWMQYFASRTEKELAMITKDYPAINKAVGVLKALSADDEAYEVAEKLEQRRRDEASRLWGAMEAGRREGRKEGQIATARNMLADHASCEYIARMTGLTLDEIRKLAGEA